MQLLKNFLARLYAVYALILFAISLLIVVLPVWVCSFLKEPKRSAVILDILRGWMAIFLPAIFCPVKRIGRGNFKKGKNYVVVCNHNSLMDVPVSTPSVPGINKTLAKIEMAKIPVFGLIYRSGSILIDRKDPRSRKESYKQMKQVLLQNMHLVLYPEGTRNKTEMPLKAFYDGAFSVAIETQKPIMPAVIFNTKKILPPGRKFYGWPSPIYIHFLPPIETQGLTSGDVIMLKENVHQLMTDYYLSHQKKPSRAD